VNLGLACWNVGELDRATEAFRMVLDQDPSPVDALRGLAAISVERENYDDALDYQAKLIEAGERSPELFYNTGLLLQKAGQVDDAIRLYKEALEEKPEFAEALLNLGHAMKEKGQPDEARGYWKKALEVKPELGDGYYERASR
jgi:tetratricopeptide (TPR) repeat protein